MHCLKHFNIWNLYHNKTLLQEGDIIEICINYSNSHFITAQYTVNWVLNRGPKNMYGLSIIHIDDKNKFLMSELIDELEDIEKIV